MKKLLSIIGTISFITSGSSNLIVCNNTPALTSEKLAELKEKNSKTIDGNKLEWIAPQEKPFDTVDNKWYVLIWRSNENDSWKITKFLNNTNSKKELDSYGRYKLIFKEYSPFYDFTLLIRGERGDADHTWKNDNGTYFKAVYHWNGKNEPPILKINSDGEIEN